MDRLYTSGESVFEVSGKRKIKFLVSVVSVRAGYWILRKSACGEWAHPVARLDPPIYMKRSGLIIIGFSADSGLHIAVKEKCGWED